MALRVAKESLCFVTLGPFQNVSSQFGWFERGADGSVVVQCSRQSGRRLFGRYICPDPGRFEGPHYAPEPLRLKCEGGFPIYMVSSASLCMPVTERRSRSRKWEADMDLNQLLYHHQMALMAASQAQRDGRILPNFDLPRYYAKRINEYREQRGLDDNFIPASELSAGPPRADPPTSEADVGYPAYIGDTLIAEILVNKALSMTPEERTAYALDGIVGRLAGIQEDLWVVGRDIYRALGLDEAGLAQLASDSNALCPAEGEEADHPKPLHSLSEEGIAHSYVDQFRVGSFRYSNINDARAALLRQRIGDGSSDGQANA